MEGNSSEVKQRSSSRSSGGDCSSEGQEPPEAPDGGWGWVIVFASFMCNVVVDGIIFSFGIFLMELANAFNEPKAKTSWIGSLMAGFYLLVGPVVSGFANTFGCRPVTLAGSIIATVGLLVSWFATDIPFLCVSFGVVGGIGFGFIYLPATVSVNFYFVTKRAFALGIAVCGSGIGAFGMAPLVQFLIERYGWRGAMLILSGVVLNCSIFGCLFRPLEPRPSRRPSESQKPLLLRIKEARDALMKWDSEECLKDGTMPILSRKKYETNSSGSPTESESSPPPPYSEVVADESIFRYDTKKALQVKKRSKGCNAKAAIANRPFYRQDILFSASVLNLPQFQSQPDVRQYTASVTNLPTDSQDDHESSGFAIFSPAMRDTFKQMLDVSLLSSPTFVFVCVSGFLTLAGFFVPFMYIIDCATLAGIGKEKAALILSVIGITNTVGRVFSGWLSDRPKISALMVNNWALTAGGLATALMPVVAKVYGLLLVCATVFGFSIACFAALRSIILVQLLGLEKLSNAFGLLLLFQGIASMIGAPVAGMFFDMTGSYDLPFYMAGGLIAVSGLMCFALPYISRWEKSREVRKQLENYQGDSKLYLRDNSSNV